ncbi:MAG: hypothetical protein UEJ45_05065 [Peptococcaceae bacterium]|nr:hypothetical protein [Peptococcaceae bacterium]
MIKLTNTDVHGFDVAINGMRNPMNSWRLSDSFECKHYEDFSDWHDVCQHEECPMLKYIHTGEDIHTGPNEYHIECTAECEYVIGEEDLKLMHQLASAGDDHGKFARFINVTIDIVAPLYWWKEFDTYKVGTVSNSCSTMHKIMAKPFEVSDFSLEKVQLVDNSGLINELLELCNDLRDIYINYDEYKKTHTINKNIKSKKDVWYILIQLLPSSYNQRRTVQLNYQVLNRIVNARQNHKLDEWHMFCDWALNLPYFKAIYGDK